jgi:thioredoxin reductase (NADPH)
MDRVLTGKEVPAGLRHDTQMPEDPRYRSAFAKLTDQQIQALEPYGKRKQITKGETVWAAGTVNLCMYVIVKGDLDIMEPRSGKHIATHGEGSFSGDIDILSGRASLVNAVAGTDLELLEIPADCVRSIVAERPEVGEIILRAYLLRRALLIETGTGALVVVGSRFCPDTLRIREFLTRNLYPVFWEDLESSPSTKKALDEFHIDVDETPIVILPSGDVLRVPTNTQLAEALGIKKPADSKIYDLVIVGAGPAGLAAAVYGASEGLSTLVLDSIGPGGQAGNSSKIENYMGFPLGLTGQELADGALVQAEKFGAQFIVPADVRSITCRPIGGHVIEIENEEKIECKAVILASGAHYRKLECAGGSSFDGRGVYYSATYLEQMMCGNNRIAVVGGGNSAGQAAIYMADSAEHVCLIVRGKNLGDTMSSYLARRIERHPKITLHLRAEITELHGSGALQEITVTHKDSKEVRKEPVAALFVMIGAVPHTDWLPPTIVRDPKGFILTGPELAADGAWSQQRPPFFLETSCPGVFAAGDARASSIKRVASAVGEGAMAVALVHQYLSTFAYRDQPIEVREEPRVAALR